MSAKFKVGDYITLRGGCFGWFDKIFIIIDISTYTSEIRLRRIGNNEEVYCHDFSFIGRIKLNLWEKSMLGKKHEK